MLVLSRKKEESLIIGNEIKVTILGISNDTVKLGISAPASISIYRNELYDAICQENKVASRPELTDLRIIQKMFSEKKLRLKSKTGKPVQITKK